MTDELDTAGATGAGLADRLCRLIDAEVSLDPGVRVEPDTDLLLTGLVDSLGVMRIVQWIEDELALVVEPTEVVLENFVSVEAMVGFIGRRLGGS